MYFKDRFSRLLNTKFILDELKVKYQLRKNLLLIALKIPRISPDAFHPPKFSSDINLRRRQFTDESDRLSLDLRWKTRGKNFWLDKLTVIERHSAHIKITTHDGHMFLIQMRQVSINGSQIPVAQ
jgi:hypothetical protein